MGKLKNIFFFSSLFCFFFTQAQTQEHARANIKSNSFGYSENVKVEILSEYTKLNSSIQNFWVGIYFKMKPNWHIYWKNPGDSGLPPSVEWDTTSFIQIENEFIFPIPQKYYIKPIMNYVYKDNVFLVAKAKIKSNKLHKHKEDISIQANIKWLECNDVCLSSTAGVNISIPIGNIEKSNRFQQFFVKQKKLFAQEDINSTFQGDANCNPPILEAENLRIQCKHSLKDIQKQKIYFYIEQKGVVRYVYSQKMVVDTDTENFLLSIPRELNFPKKTKKITGYIVMESSLAGIAPKIWKFHQKLQKHTNKKLDYGYSKKKFIIFALFVIAFFIIIVKIFYRTQDT